MLRKLPMQTVGLLPMMQVFLGVVGTGQAALAALKAKCGLKPFTVAAALLQEAESRGGSGFAAPLLEQSMHGGEELWSPISNTTHALATELPSLPVERTVTCKPGLLS